MKRALLLLLLLITLSGLQAQDYDFLEKDWTRIAQKKEGLRISPMFLKGFLPSGEEVKPSDMMTFLMKIEYAPAIFVDLKQNPVAIVFEKASEEQMAARIKRFENFSGGDFMRNQKAPDFTIADLDGKEFKLSEFKGDYVLLNFWFIGCSPCIKEIPELNELVEEFEPKGIHFVAIGLDKAVKTRNFLDTKMPFNYRLLPNGGRVSQSYGVNSYPTHLLIDRSGKVIFSQQGYFPGLKHALKKYLLEVSEE